MSRRGSNNSISIIFKFLNYRKMSMDLDVGFSALRVDHMPITAVILCLVNAYAVMDIQVQCVTGPVQMAPMGHDVR